MNIDNFIFNIFFHLSSILKIEITRQIIKILKQISGIYNANIKTLNFTRSLTLINYTSIMHIAYEAFIDFYRYKIK